MQNSEGEKALLEHFRLGLSNSQDTIRALDAKAGVLSAFTFLMITGWLGVVKFAFEEDLHTKITWHFSTCLLAAIFFGIFACGLIAMGCLIWSVKGREKDKVTFYSLFPYYLPNQKEAAKETFYDEGLLKPKAQLDEFRDQLVTLGGILEKKIRWGYYACIALLFQFGCVALTALGLLLVWLL